MTSVSVSAYTAYLRWVRVTFRICMIHAEMTFLNSSVHRYISLVPASTVSYIYVSLPYWSCPALLYYDYFLTLDKEVKFYWGRKPGIIRGLFYVNRYVSLVGVCFYPVHNLSALTDKVKISNYLTINGFPDVEFHSSTYRKSRRRWRGLIFINV